MCRIFRSDKDNMKPPKSMEIKRGDDFDEDESMIKENPIYRYTIEKIIKYIN